MPTRNHTFSVPFAKIQRHVTIANEARGRSAATTQMLLEALPIGCLQLTDDGVHAVRKQARANAPQDLR